MVKECFKCGCVLPLDMFYKHPKMPDGHVNKCKACNKRDVRENRAAKVEYYRDYDKIRGNYDERIRSRIPYQREYRERFPEKYKAHMAVSVAVRGGRLVNPCVCETCGESFPKKYIHAHHDDYSKPLDVRWVCVACHAKEHPREQYYA